MAAPRTPAFRGRTRERQVLDGLLDRVRGGESAMLVIRGEAGVCLVDDAQWLDGASSQVLGFVGRRLLAESVLLLFAVREAADERMFPGLTALTVEGLTDEDARALLTAAVPGHLDEQVRDRIVAETRGNPRWRPWPCGTSTAGWC